MLGLHRMACVRGRRGSRGLVSSAAADSRPREQVLEELPPLYEMPPNEVKWVERMLEYNVKGGKMNRGLMVVESVQELAKFMGKELSPQEVSRFAVLGWAIEWMQAWLLMADDIMDDSPTRRGQPCWWVPWDWLLGQANFVFVMEKRSSLICRRRR